LLITDRKSAIERAAMAYRTSKTPFQGTKAQENLLVTAIDELRDERGSLIAILQKAQDIYGYLPIEVQKIISERMGVPLEEIYGVATFYAQFSLTPKGQYQISCCLGTACYVRGAGDFFQKISDELEISSGESTPDGKFSLEACRCIGACGLAPVLTVNDDVYGRLTSDEVDKILAKY
jgi:NADP-reducing hydrogenase subunit HndA